MPRNSNLMLTVVLLYIVPLINGDCSTGQPPRFTLEPQDAVLPTARGSDSVRASIHCTHESPDTNLTWYRDGLPMEYDETRILHPNGTLEFRPLIDRADVTVVGVKYQCMLSNAFGSVISRTALLQSATFGSEWNIADAPVNVVDVTMGSFILLPCDPPAANPPPIVQWTRDGTVLVPGDTTKYKVLSPEAGSGLIIANVVAGDIGPTYRCRVTNAFVFSSRNSPFTHQLNQIDRYPANLTIYDTIESLYILPTGSNAEFTCLALANDVTDLEFLYRRLDAPTIPNNIVRTTHDATTIVGRTTMTITNVREDNAGMYQCLVSNIDAQGTAFALGNRNFTIQVSVAPAITSVPGDQVFYIGDTKTLECGATGFPAPVISYYFNATLITTGVSNGVLTLTSVTATDTGPYQCFADYVRADSSALWVITVRDPVAPVMLAASTARATVPENDNIILNIDVSADPAPTATWQLNGGDLPSTATAALNVIDGDTCPGTYQAVLTVTGFTVAHSGTYTVTVMNRAGSITHSFQRAQEVPAFVTSLTGIGTGDNCVTRDQDSNLTCTYGGVPQPTVLWYTLTGDGDSIRRNIPVSDAEYVVHKTSTETILTIRNVDDGDNVKYICEATNTVNSTVKMGRITKQFDICSMPVFTTPLESKTEVNVMEDVRLYCNGKGEPEVTYEWFYTNSSGIRNDPVDGIYIRLGVEEDTGVNYLEITGVMEDDQGNYTCQITTPVGTLESTGVLKVNDPQENNATENDTPTTQNNSTSGNDSTVIIVIITVLCTIILILVVIIFICFYQRLHTTNGNADAEVYDDVISENINKVYKVGVGTHLQVNSSHAVNASNADNEAYDDVISGKIIRPIYETIHEVGVGTHLQDNSSHATSARKQTVTTTNADPCYAAATTTTSIESVTMQSDPAYGAAIRKGIVTTANTELVTMQTDPAYGGNEVNTTELKSESLV